MSSPRAVRLNLFAAILSAALAIVAGVELVGHTTRLVDVITLVGGGVGAGAGLAGAIVSARRVRRAVG